MTSRSGSVRLRSSLTTKEEGSGSGLEAKRRRLNVATAVATTTGNGNGSGTEGTNSNGGGTNGNENGNGSPAAVATAASQPQPQVNGVSRPRTRGMEPEPDKDENSNSIGNDVSETCANPESNEIEGSQETEDNAESSSSSSSDSSDSSDSDSSSDVDEETTETKCTEFKDDLGVIEKQFLYVRELLYKERLQGIEDKIEEVRSGRAKEYISPLEQLQENMRVRMEVAGKLRDYRTANLKNKYDAEALAAYQNRESEKALLYDSIKTDLEYKIQRLEEDRNNDFTSEFWLETALKRKNAKSTDIFGEKKKKPVTVSGPYVVYMLNDVDIVEDWTIIKKALAAPKRKYMTDCPAY